MDFSLLAPILQIAVIGGIATSAIASIAVVTRSFLGRSGSNAAVLTRVEKIESAIRSDTSRIDLQLLQTIHTVKPERAKIVVDDLSFVASDLKQKNLELLKIVQDFREQSRKSQSVEDTKKIAELDLKLGQTELRIEAILDRIEQQRTAPNENALHLELD